MIIKSDTFIWLISWFMKPAAITLWPFIIVSPKRVKYHGKLTLEGIISHEKIHLAQQRELLVFGFYILYVYFYVRNYVRYRNSFRAYRQIPFEIEAYKFVGHEDYDIKRKRFAWKLYI